MDKATGGAVELRKAAYILRERAAAARDVTGAGDWFSAPYPMHYGSEWCVRSSGGTVATETSEDEADFISTMSPSLAFALADWLDAEAEGWDVVQPVAYAGDVARIVNEAGAK